MALFVHGEQFHPDLSLGIQVELDLDGFQVFILFQLNQGQERIVGEAFK